MAVGWAREGPNPLITLSEPFVLNLWMQIHIPISETPLDGSV